MPFKSERQRRYMHKFLPSLASKWEHRYGSRPEKIVKGVKKRRKSK